MQVSFVGSLMVKHPSGGVIFIGGENGTKNVPEF
jgi:hypothetical protein